MFELSLVEHPTVAYSKMLGWDVKKTLAN
jgi:hypothetical protein